MQHKYFVSLHFNLFKIVFAKLANFVFYNYVCFLTLKKKKEIMCVLYLHFNDLFWLNPNFMYHNISNYITFYHI